MDNLTEVSEGRRIAFLGLVALLFLTIVPYEHAIEVAQSTILSITEYLKVVAATGAPPIENKLFSP
jgi:hypothetical protein